MAKNRMYLAVEDKAFLEESPHSKKLRNDACLAMKKGGRKIKADTMKVGRDIDVGSIVKAPLKDVNFI